MAPNTASAAYRTLVEIRNPPAMTTLSPIGMLFNQDSPYWQPSGSSGSPNEIVGSYSRSCEACHGAPGGEAWPSSSEPQQATEASAFIPQVWYSPALTETNSPSGGED